MLFGNTSMNPPSRFIGEIDPNLIEKEESKVVEKSFDKAKFYNDEGATYKHGDIVMHTIFGKGVVIDSDENLLQLLLIKDLE